jgi:hypothetical protein
MFLTNLSFCSLHHVKERCSASAKLVVSIVFATVVPDWECKSAGFIFNMQVPVRNIFPKIFTQIHNRLINKAQRSKNFLKIFEVFDYMHL